MSDERGRAPRRAERVGLLQVADDGIPPLRAEEDPQAVVTAVEHLLEIERADDAELRHLRKDLADFEDTTLWPLLVDLMRLGHPEAHQDPRLPPAPRPAHHEGGPEVIRLIPAVPGDPGGGGACDEQRPTVHTPEHPWQPPLQLGADGGARVQRWLP